jgi:hypothetical protein
MKKFLLSAMVLGLTLGLANAQEIVVDEFTGNTSSGIGTAEPGPEYGAGVSVISYENDMLVADYSWVNSDWYPRAVYYRFKEYVNCKTYPNLVIKFMVTDNDNEVIPVRFDLYGEGTINGELKQEVETNARPWEIQAENAKWYTVSDNFIDNNRFACTYFGGGIPETRVDSSRINGFEAFASYGNASFNGKAGKLFIDYIKLSSVTTGVDEYIYGKPSAFSLAVYPNPAVNSVSVNAENKIETVDVIDVTGKVVLTVNQVNDRKANIDLTKLNTGLYFVNVTDVNGNSVSKKLLKN